MSLKIQINKKKKMYRQYEHFVTTSIQPDQEFGELRGLDSRATIFRLNKSPY